MSRILVPDSIEPYLGWKVLILATTRFGILQSPQQGTIWRPQQRLEADCGARIHKDTHIHRYEWVVREGEAPAPGLHPYTPGHISDFYANATTSMSAFTSNTGFHHARLEVPTTFYWVPAGANNFPDPPQELLPEGQYWAWEANGVTEWVKGIEVVNAKCSCGIYAVDDQDELAYYLMAQRAVIARVALWGRVIPGTKGARGQYAYPQQLIFPPDLASKAEKVAAAYGVPYLIKPHPYTPAKLSPPKRTEVHTAIQQFNVVLCSTAFALIIAGWCLSFFTSGHVWLIPLATAIFIVGLVGVLDHVRRST